MLFNVALEVLGTVVRHEKEIRKEVKLSSFTNDMILYVEKPKNPKNTVTPKNNFSKVVGYKIDTKINCVSLH